MRLVHRLIFQAEDGIRDLYMSRGLGDVYKRQCVVCVCVCVCSVCVCVCVCVCMYVCVYKLRLLRDLYVCVVLLQRARARWRACMFGVAVQYIKCVFISHCHDTSALLNVLQHVMVALQHVYTSFAVIM